MKEFNFVVDQQFNSIKPLDFLRRKGVSDEILNKVKFGGVFINDKVSKNANERIGFGDKVKIVLPKDFTPIKRQETLAKIKTQDYDGIIIPSSCFDSIPLSKEYYVKKYKEAEQRLNEIASKTNKNASCFFNLRRVFY